MLEMIRVLVVETTKFGYDGITNVITNYYTYMNHNKVHMDLVTINPIDDKFKENLELNDSINFVLPYRNRNPFKYIYELKQIMEEGNYSIVHVHGCSATMAVEMFAAKLANIKIRISHSHNTKCDHMIIDKILRPFFYNWCNCRFACGKEAGEWLFPKQKFHIISNGIDLERFQYNPAVRSEIRNRYGLNKKIVIGHVGRFTIQKNHNKLIDIFGEFSKYHPEAYLLLIGDGELRDAIEKRVKREKLSVLFIDPNHEVEKWLQVMDVIVFPSLFEGLPLGLIEAQAAGLPCVLSNTISPMTKITDLVEFVDLNEKLNKWCTAIENIIEKYNRQDHIENVKSQIRESHYDIRLCCQELVRFYEKILNGKKQVQI